MDEYNFRQALALGFRVMRLNPDLGGEESGNLALLWPEDHDKVVDAVLGSSATPVVQKAPQEPSLPTRPHKGRACYELRSKGLKWQEISDTVKSRVGNVVALARTYANTRGLPFPPQTTK